MVNEFDFYVVAVVRRFFYNFNMGLPVNICWRSSTPVVFGFDVFIYIFLEAESSKLILIVVGDVIVIEVDCKGGERNMIVYWWSGVVISDGFC